MRVVGIDHLVLTVASIERAVDFYRRVMGMEAVQFGPDKRWALTFGPHKINLHEKGREFEPKATVALPGSADLCFLVDDFEDLDGHLKAQGVEAMMGPVPRTGARGMIMSYYIRDPDLNLIELSVYPDGKKAAS